MASKNRNIVTTDINFGTADIKDVTVTMRHHNNVTMTIVKTTLYGCTAIGDYLAFIHS